MAGRPKGVVLTHRLLFEGARTIAGLAVGMEDRRLAVRQFSHIGAIGLVYLLGTTLGASVVLLGSFEAAAALDLIERFGCANIFALQMPATDRGRTGQAITQRLYSARNYGRR